jgi:cytochrome c2
MKLVTVCTELGTAETSERHFTQCLICGDHFVDDGKDRYGPLVKIICGHSVGEKYLQE